MYSFIYRAETLDGKPIIERIVADTMDAAWLLLEQKGYKEIELIDNESTAINLMHENAQSRLKRSAEQDLALRAEKSIFLRQLKTFAIRYSPYLRKLLIVFVVVISLFALQFLFFQPETVISFWSLFWLIEAHDYVETFLEILLFLFVWLLWDLSKMPAVTFHRAEKAWAWGKWQKLEKLIRQVQGSEYLTPEQSARLNPNLTYILAIAKAGQGQLSEAMNYLAFLETDTSLPTDTYYGRLASLFFARKDYQQALDCQRKAYAINPSGLYQIDLATTLAERFKSYHEASQLLDELDEKKLHGLVKLNFYCARGIIALETNHPQQACHYFEKIFSLGNYFGNPLIQQGLLLKVSAYYALALVAVGKLADAKKYFKRSRSILIARGEAELLARCDKAQTRKL